MYLGQCVKGTYFIFCAATYAEHGVGLKHIILYSICAYATEHCCTKVSRGMRKSILKFVCGYLCRTWSRFESFYTADYLSRGMRNVVSFQKICLILF